MVYKLNLPQIPRWMKHRWCPPYISISSYQTKFVSKNSSKIWKREL